MTKTKQNPKTANKWVITIGGYGAFFFDGNEKDAEEKRADKSRWESAIGRKRIADQNEVETGKIDYCKNHPNFNTKDRYHCICQKCKD